MGRGIIKEYMSVERVGSRRMEVYAVLVLGALFFPTLSLAATVTYASNKVMGPTSGLVGYWTMNAQDINWTTGNVLDRSGLGNNGILTNMATKTAPVAGKLGQGMRFIGGTTDRINAGSAASLDDITTLTVSFWVRPHSIWGYSTMISKGSWQGSGWALVFKGYDSHIAFLRDFAGTDGIWESNGTPTFKKDAWMHVTLTYDKSSVSNTPLIYVNGSRIILSTTTAPTGSVNPESSYNLHVGADGGGVMGSFPGSLDEVRIYNRILTPTEIKQLYNVGQVQLASTPKKNTSGLVGWWTFDAKDINWTTNTALDRSGYGNNGILTNMATKTSPITGKLGQGIYFDYTHYDDQEITVPNSVSLDAFTNTTLSVWMRPLTSGGSAAGTILDKGPWRFGYWGGSFEYRQNFTGTNGRWHLTTNPVYRQWTHVVVTYDRTTLSAPTFYVNGVVKPSTQDTAPSGVWVSDVGASLRIGNLIGARQFNGTLDDVRIYNRILSPTEVAQLYKEGQVTVNSFTCGQSTVKDVDGNVYNTVKIGTQCWMKQNMRVGTRINGATNQTNNGIIEKYCYNDTASNCTTNHPNYPDGGLYQWDEAMQYSTTPGARGICPAGWHIPTHDEFTTLERAVCTSGSCATDFPFNTTTTGERGTGEEFTLTSGGSSGYEMNISGKRSFVGGSFMFRNSYTYFWSSTDNFGTPWFRRVSSGLGTIFRDGAVTLEGYSVRCLKN